MPVLQRQAIRAILLTPEHEVLLMRIQNPDSLQRFWITPGGGQEPGETVTDTLTRELREELGLANFTLGPLVWLRQHTFNWVGKRLCQREQYYIVTVQRFNPVMSDVAEAEYLDCFKWWSVGDLAAADERLTPLSLASIVCGYIADGPPLGPISTEVLVD